MPASRYILLFYFVYICSLLNLILLNESFTPVYVVSRYIVFGIFLATFIYKLLTRQKFNDLSSVDKLVMLLFVYNIIQSALLGADIKGSFKIIFGQILVLLIARNAEKSKLAFYNTFNLIFVSLFVIHFYFFYLQPFLTTSRIVRVDIGGLNGNEIAGIFASLFPFSIMKIRSRSPSTKNPLTIVFIIVYLYILIFYNGSRFAIFSSVISSAIILFFLVLRKNARQSRIKPVKLITLIILPIFVVLIAGEKFFGKDEFFSRRLSDIVTGEHQEGNLAGRIGGIWVPLIVQVAEQSPILGFGNESVTELAEETTFWFDNQNRVIQYARDVHNFLVTIYVELGGIGITIFCMIYFKIIRGLIRFTRRSSEKSISEEKILVICSFIGFTSWLLTANAWYSGGWYVLFFYIFFVNMIKNRDAYSNENPADIK